MLNQQVAMKSYDSYRRNGYQSVSDNDLEKIAIKILIDGVTPGKSPSVIRRSGDNDLNRQFSG
jgi:hypothetical protein